MAFFTWCHAGLARFYETARGEGRLGRHFATGYLTVAVLCVIVGVEYVAAVGLLGLSEAVRTALFFGLAALLLRRSEEHTSELQSLMRISYAVFCLIKKNITNNIT